MALSTQGLPRMSLQTRREFVIGSSSSGEGESGSAITEGPMEAGGSSVEAVVGAACQPETSDGVDGSSVPVFSSPLVSNAVASSSRPVRSGKLNSFNDHVIHRNSDMLSLSSYLGCCLKLFIRYCSSGVCFGNFSFFVFDLSVAILCHFGASADYCFGKTSVFHRFKLFSSVLSENIVFSSF